MSRSRMKPVSALVVCLLAGPTWAQQPGQAGPEPLAAAPDQAFYENRWIETVGPAITFNRAGGPAGLPNSRIDIGNNGYGFWVSEPGPDGTFLRLQNSYVSDRSAYVKAPLVVGSSVALSPHYGSSLSVYGNGNGRLTVEDYASQVAGRNLLRLVNNGPATFRFENRASGATWGFGSIVADDKFFITKGGAAGLDLTLDGAGNLVILGTLTQLSDRNAKRDVREVDGGEVLRKLAGLPLSSWSYKADEHAARHVGPMAQDFAAAFGLGHDDTHVAPSDVAGVSLAAVQALQREVDARLADKEAQLATLTERLSALERALARQP